VSAGTCRSCAGPLRTFLSLGTTPLADALVPPGQRTAPEPRFPLDVAFCHDCSLVQILEEVPPDRLFVENYLYFSSYSDVLVRHARDHVIDLVERQRLGPSSLVVEVASNDGYLLRHFADHGIPVLGIDPAPDQAAAAEAIGVPTLREFFGASVAQRLRERGRVADVIIACNVMAHTPDLNGFVEGLAILLADDGIARIENPYVRDLIERCEFDTIYHEHFSYFSCTAVDALMRRHGLRLVDIERFPDLHGGTLRWTVAHDGARDPSPAVRRYLDEERAIGLDRFAFYEAFGTRVRQVGDDLLSMVRGLKAGGARIAAYGAAAKGSTLVNFVGLGPDLIDYVVDRNPHKQGKLMPGVHLPISDPSRLLEDRPDYLLLLAWNFRDEIIAQQSEYAANGGRFVVPIPTPEVL
jgi:SAM-dependent methyltransferase